MIHCFRKPTAVGQNGPFNGKMKAIGGNGFGIDFGASVVEYLALMANVVVARARGSRLTALFLISHHTEVLLIASRVRA